VEISDTASEMAAPKGVVASVEVGRTKMKTRNLFYRVATMMALLAVLLPQGADIPAGSAQAQDPITFTEHTIASNFDGARSVYATDVDGDGDMDILGAARLADDITWWENDGSQSFTEHTITGDFDGAHSVYATDVDEDGDVDVLGAAYDADDIAWWENDGSQSFTQHTIADYFSRASSVYAADVDGDGDVDVLGAAQSTDDITWWENTSNTSPPAVTAVTDNTGVARISVGGREIDFRPFDPEMPGLPLPAIKITAKEYPSHVIILWEDTLGDRPPPFYRPVAEFLKTPLEFSSRSMPLDPVSDDGSARFSVYLPIVVQNWSRTSMVKNWSRTSMTVLDDQPEGWDVSGPAIAPNTIGVYKKPATVSGPDFATYMKEHYPEVKHIRFYHLDKVPSIDTAVMDIYETDVEGVIAVNLRNQGSDPHDSAEAVVTHATWHLFYHHIAGKFLSIMTFMFTYVTQLAFEDYNSRCIPVPDVTGEHRDDARQVLQQMGFNVEEVESYSYATPGQVIDQYPGPKNISKCTLPGNTVKIEVSLGLKPTEYELYEVRVTDTRKNTKTNFTQCDDVFLWMKGVNHRRNPLTVSYSWNTYGPDGQQIEALSLNNWEKEEQPDWVSYPRLEGPIPAISGEYTFVGSATFNSQIDGSKITLERRTYFQVSDGQVGPISLQKAVTCKGVDPETAQPVNETDVFNTQDSAVYAWSRWEGADGDHSVQWKWYRPGGTLFFSYTLEFSTIYCTYYTWGWLNIAGTPAVNYPGNWRVDIYMDGQHVRSLNFNLVSAAGSNNMAFVTSERGSGLGMASGFAEPSSPTSELNGQPRR
jgi:hypothetical protein